MRLRLTIGVLGALALGCGAGSPCGEGTVEKDGECVADEDGDSTGGSDSGGDSATGGDASPEILSFAANTGRATEGDTLVFTAVVTDADGAGDLIGGTLESPSGATYGAFTTTAQEGAYELSVAWSALDTVAEIQFEGEETRSFTARFYDQAGHVAERSTDVTLYCAQGAACGGSCVSLSVDERNCGACGNVCEGVAVANYSTTGTCEAGACVEASSCVDDIRQSCDDICGNEGMTCWGGIDYPGVVIDVYGGEGDGVPSCDEYRTTTTTSRCSQDLIDAPQAQSDDWGACFCLRAP